MTGAIHLFLDLFADVSLDLNCSRGGTSVKGASMPPGRWGAFELDAALLANAVDNMSSAGRVADSFVRRFNISITRKYFRTLYGNNKQNDQVCNFYMELVMQRNAAATTAAVAGVLCSALPKVRILTTHPLKQLVLLGYDKVKHWTKNFDVFDADMVMFPVNMKNEHWTLVNVDFRRRSVLYYDSMGGDGTELLAKRGKSSSWRSIE